MNTIADPNCYSCRSTGTIDGFGLTGRECACVAHCEICDGAISWRHDDERAPLLCSACSCPSTKRSIFCEGLATWLVWLLDETGATPAETFAYVDATSADEALAIVRAWSVDTFVAIPHRSLFADAWELAEARRDYVASAEALRTMAERLPAEPGLYETFVTRLASEGVSEVTVARAGA